MHKLILMVLFDLSDEYVIGPPNNSLERTPPQRGFMFRLAQRHRSARSR